MSRISGQVVVAQRVGHGATKRGVLFAPCYRAVLAGAGLGTAQMLRKRSGKARGFDPVNQIQLEKATAVARLVQMDHHPIAHMVIVIGRNICLARACRVSWLNICKCGGHGYNVQLPHPAVQLKYFARLLGLLFDLKVERGIVFVVGRVRLARCGAVVELWR